MSDLLPVHGFVLAGGKSTRMGIDKATLAFRGRPMVEIAVEKLRGFCADVSIAGNREDLARFAPVVLEQRIDAGPTAGLEAGLKASRYEWALFVPVDVPLVPADLLRCWAANALAMGSSGLGVSQLVADGQPQPAFCLLRTDRLPLLSASLDAGERRIRRVLEAVVDSEGRCFGWGHDAAAFAANENASREDIKHWFSNVNTPQELQEAEAWNNQNP